MPRLGGGNFGQSYLIGLSDHSSTHTATETTVSYSASSPKNDGITAATAAASGGGIGHNNNIGRTSIDPSIITNSSVYKRVGEVAPSSTPHFSSSSSVAARIMPNTPRTPAGTSSNSHSGMTATGTSVPMIPAPSSLRVSTSAGGGMGGGTAGTVGGGGSSIIGHRHSSAAALSSASGMLYSPRMSPTRRNRTVGELPMLVHPDSAPTQKTNRNVIRAAEAGNGTILPDFTATQTSAGGTAAAAGGNATNPHSNSRRIRRGENLRTRSGNNLHRVMGLKGRHGTSSPSLPQTQQDITGGANGTNPNATNSSSSTSNNGQPTKKSIMQSAMKQSLRRRTASACPSDDEEAYIPPRRNYSHAAAPSSGRSDGDSPFRSSTRGSGRGSRRTSSWFSIQHKLSHIKLSNILRIVIVVAVTALVWESHHKALLAAQQLSTFQSEESMLLLHLQQIELQYIQLHENLSRLAAQAEGRTEGSNGTNGNDDAVAFGAGKAPDGGSVGGAAGAAPGVDFDLIHKQTQQLYQMEAELDSEVKTLQKRIQDSARNHIVQEFGEGPVQIVLELDFPKSVLEEIAQAQPDNSLAVSKHPNNRVEILLWHDTPHAAWTWLEQIGRKTWDGTELQWQQNDILEAIPIQPDDLGGKIEFVETSHHSHEAFTVGVKETENGAMSMFINLRDNTNERKYETCVGKVVDGYDALSLALDGFRIRNNRDRATSSKNNNENERITVKKVTAVHVSKNSI